MPHAAMKRGVPANTSSSSSSAVRGGVDISPLFAFLFLQLLLLIPVALLEQATLQMLARAVL